MDQWRGANPSLSGEPDHTRPKSANDGTICPNGLVCLRMSMYTSQTQCGRRSTLCVNDTSQCIMQTQTKFPNLERLLRHSRCVITAGTPYHPLPFLTRRSKSAIRPLRHIYTGSSNKTENSTHLMQCPSAPNEENLHVKMLHDVKTVLSNTLLKTYWHIHVKYLHLLG